MSTIDNDYPVEYRSYLIYSVYNLFTIVFNRFIYCEVMDMKGNLEITRLSDAERERKISIVSGIGVAANILLSVIKAIAGVWSGSAALISDSVNNLTDSASSLVTIIGTRMASKKADEEHPFGHKRGEYLTSLAIGIIILMTGLQSLFHSAENIYYGTQPEFTTLTLGVIGFSILVKMFLSSYTIKVGRETCSGALTASGQDARNDIYLSVGTLISSLLYMFAHINVDAWMGVIISLFVTRVGVLILLEISGKLLGQRVPDSLAAGIYQKVNSAPFILGSYDLVLNNYGPGQYIGSINVELDKDTTVGEVYPLLHHLQDEIDRIYHVYIVFGFYAVHYDDERSKAVVKVLNEFKKRHSECLNFHGIDIYEKNKCVYADITLQYGCNRKQLKQEAEDLIEKTLPGYHAHITIDTEFSNSRFTRSKRRE